MKAFLFIFTIILLILRVRDTPRQLSEKVFREKYQEQIDKYVTARHRANLDFFKDDFMNKLKNISIGCALLFAALSISYYVLVMFVFNNVLLSTLSGVQIITVYYSVREIYITNPFSENVNDFRFHKWFFLLNVILDYIYYPLVLFILVK